MADELRDRLATLPLVAILRGLEPVNAEAVGATLVETGFAIIEVPLNSPRPLDSIAILARVFGDRALIGAGTVLQREDVAEVAAAGGRLIVMPHGDAALIAASKAAGLHCMPGVATPTEGFAALSAGADALKLFPGELLAPAVVKAWRAVFPADVQLLPVGGITPERIAGYRAAGASGFGLGSALFKPGISPAELRRNAERFVAAIRATAD